jgi:hypothetical protein
VYAHCAAYADAFGLGGKEYLIANESLRQRGPGIRVAFFLLAASYVPRVDKHMFHQGRTSHAADGVASAKRAVSRAPISYPYSKLTAPGRAPKLRPMSEPIRGAHPGRERL